ncbi:hypothetical protein D9V32_09870 [Mycetocola tolaasinivorans]|uniref:Secreted protein n=1 Tax=Mycetocola tolaasinivorans TaxID=76635 RepID=A0A3L7A768_9MICO|nr:peptidase inhibitor family I36 protein [Mycetocola tolaasinivorans]RLP75202.1 hypothetical protein D9V32_09870 [Mycetocola tolaasinivorans]
MKLSTRLLSGTALLAALLFGGATAASAAAPAGADAIQARVDRVLVEFPGGVQTGPGEVTWGGGEAILTIVDEASTGFSTFAVGSCATGNMCAYTGVNQTGSRIIFTSCTAANSVSPLGSPVRSIANARNSGLAFGFNGTTPNVIVSAGDYVNTNAKVTRVGC